MTLEGYNPRLIKQLTTLIDSGRLPQAIVIDGGSLEARRTLAKKLAEAMLCTASAEKPCGQCLACKKVAAEIHPDVTYVLPEEGKKTLAIERLRDMRADAFVLPNDGDRKVYIIPEAERMLPVSQNTLLKVLEEPPTFSSFILCVESKSVLLSTVLSRVTVFSLNTDKTDGMDRTVLAGVKEKAGMVARTLATGKEWELLQALSYFEKNYDELLPVLDQLELVVRDALVAESGSNTLLSGQPEVVKALADGRSKSALFAIIQELETISTAIALYGNKNLTLSRLSSGLAAIKA